MNRRIYEAGIFAMRPLDDNCEAYIITNDMSFYFYTEHGEFWQIKILPGFEFDGASIPRFFWRIIGSPLRGRHVIPALLHDALYAAEYLPRAEADMIFRRHLAQAKIGRIKRNAMYYAVRLGGWAVYRAHDFCSIRRARKYVKKRVSELPIPKDMSLF